MKSALLGASILVLCGAFALMASAQQQFRVDVRMVDVVATVTDEKGRYVPNLTVDDFMLMEDGVFQKVAHVSQSRDLPVSVGILLDVSGSMDRKLQTALAAIERFVRVAHKDDDVFLLLFSDRSVVAQDFTADRNKLTAAMRNVRVGRGTALYNAVNDGLLHLRRGAQMKRALLLVTDGQESGGSDDTFDDALQNVRRENVLMYCLGIAPAPLPIMQESLPFPFPLRGFVAQGALAGRGQAGRGQAMDGVDMAPLRAFADASGGRAWLVGEDGSNLDRIMDIIAEELRNQYTVGYYPASAGKVEGWRRIELKTRNSRYSVRSRMEYFGR